MLPFLKPKKAADTVTVVTNSSGESKPDHTNEGMVSRAEEILSAIAMKDAELLASALQNAFMMMDSAVPEDVG